MAIVSTLATAGSEGFFISGDGYVVTNNHVVADGISFEVSSDSGKTCTSRYPDCRRKHLGNGALYAPERYIEGPTKSKPEIQNSINY